MITQTRRKDLGLILRHHFNITGTNISDSSPGTPFSINNVAAYQPGVHLMDLRFYKQGVRDLNPAIIKTQVARCVSDIVLVLVSSVFNTYPTFLQTSE